MPDTSETAAANTAFPVIVAAAGTVPPRNTSGNETSTSGEGGSKDPNAFELVKFLMERAHAEAGIFWVRNGIFIVLQPAALAWVFTVLAKDEVKNPGYVVGAGISGCVLALIWVFMNYAGRVMNHRYVEDAKRIVGKTPGLQDVFPTSLSNTGGTPSSAAKTADMLTDLLNGPKGSATWWVYVLAAVFGLGWLTIVYHGCFAMGATNQAKSAEIREQFRDIKKELDDLKQKVVGVPAPNAGPNLGSTSSGQLGGANTLGQPQGVNLPALPQVPVANPPTKGP